MVFEWINNLIKYIKRVDFHLPFNYSLSLVSGFTNTIWQRSNIHYLSMIWENVIFCESFLINSNILNKCGLQIGSPPVIFMCLSFLTFLSFFYINYKYFLVVNILIELVYDFLDIDNNVHNLNYNFHINAIVIQIFLPRASTAAARSSSWRTTARRSSSWITRWTWRHSTLSRNHSGIHKCSKWWNIKSIRAVIPRWCL